MPVLSQAVCFASPVPIISRATSVSRTPAPRARRGFPVLPGKARNRARYPGRFLPPHAQTGGGELLLSEENVNLVLEDVKLELGSVFGNSAENQGVGITGDVSLASLDGPMVTLRLRGRFWHKRADVLARVSAYLVKRIPEICDVDIEDVSQLDDSEEQLEREV